MSGVDAVEGLGHQLSFELVERQGVGGYVGGSVSAVLEHELGHEVGAFSWSCEEGRDEVAALVAATAYTDTGQYLLPCAAVDVASSR
ncbi:MULTISPECIES: hypothetical protein [Micrococcaceae]|uniref:hypothetical protein n=1 Tax=Paenarthrobacter sp. MSM-2-10-13 TaxID=2717318 RepID=UPI001EE95948|nr:MULTISPECIES: hypothetical protein [Micrococcaceae]